VRGKLGYETNGYDPEDKLHQLLDKIGKSASVSDLMNGDVVSINPRHPQGPAALKVAHDLTNEAKENIYDILEPEDCGPFDGGCVLVAQALQKIHGGDIVVLINDRGNADHAAVKLGNTLIDYDGPLPVEKFIKRFEKNEHVKIKGIRPMKDSDLPEATRNQSLLPKIVNLLSDNINESNPFTDARMNAIKAGKKEFSVNGKTYKVTGDTSDEKAAAAREGLAEESGKEMLKIFRGMHHDAGMNKDMDRFILAHDWQLGNFTPDMFPSEEEFFDYDDPFDRIVDIDYSYRVNLSAPIIVGPQFSDGKYSVIDGNHRAAAAQRMGKTIKAYFPVEKTNENFADGKNPGRKGLAKRMGVNTKASVSDLRKTAKNSSGEKQRMAHWLANMKAGREK
jgi:hypothetical protein